MHAAGQPGRELERARRLVAGAERTVALTGAGSAAESVLPELLEP